MKPIIFSGDSVRAILDGRKTQTRRVIKPQPPEWFAPTVIDRHGEERPGDDVYGIYDADGEWGIKCPYRPDQVLWVRETWARVEMPNDLPDKIVYRATDTQAMPGRWLSPIHMPREAARLFLLVTAVRAERVREITEEDAIESEHGTHRAGFEALWDSLNAQRGYGWNKNPWVWVVQFERTDAL